MGKIVISYFYQGLIVLQTTDTLNLAKDGSLDTDLIKVTECPGRGYGLVAKQGIERGTTITSVDVPELKVNCPLISMNSYVCVNPDQDKSANR